MKNASMAIWLGKQYLGQRDPDDEFTKERIKLMKDKFKYEKETHNNQSW
jgi:hypothetical protein